MLLHRRTFHGAEGTENAAVFWAGTQQSFTTVGALIEELEASAGMLSCLANPQRRQLRIDSRTVAHRGRAGDLNIRARTGGGI